MTRFALSALSLAVLAGCSSFDPLFSSNDKVDYRSQSKQTGGLDVPPDLTQLQRQAPLGAGGSISAAALAAGPNAGGAAPSAVPVALNKVDNAEIVRVGSTRVIRSSQSPEALWPVARAFWTDLGFELPTEQPEVGVMDTDWKENRAKLPKDFVRRTIGTLFDGLYSTGEKDRFRTRMERVGDQTEITISHRGMQEVYTGVQKDQTVWQPRPADAELEAEMTSRLLMRIGGKATGISTESRAAAAAATTTATVEQTKVALADVPNEIVLSEDFEGAWRRVGQSLDRHGFTVEDRDRRAGLFFLRYADPNMAGKEEPNFFQRLFGADAGKGTARYRVAVKSEGKRSVVSVQDSAGAQATHEQAKRILQLLLQDLR